MRIKVRFPKLPQLHIGPQDDAGSREMPERNSVKFRHAVPRDTRTDIFQTGNYILRTYLVDLNNAQEIAIITILHGFGLEILNYRFRALAQSEMLNRLCDVNRMVSRPCYERQIEMVLIASNICRRAVENSS